MSKMNYFLISVDPNRQDDIVEIRLESGIRMTVEKTENSHVASFFKGIAEVSDIVEISISEKLKNDKKFFKELHKGLKTLKRTKGALNDRHKV